MEHVVFRVLLLYAQYRVFHMVGVFIVIHHLNETNMKILKSNVIKNSATILIMYYDCILYQGDFTF